MNDVRNIPEPREAAEDHGSQTPDLVDLGDAVEETKQWSYPPSVPDYYVSKGWNQ